jgi:hypothetical protein
MRRLAAPHGREPSPYLRKARARRRRRKKRSANPLMSPELRGVEKVRNYTWFLVQERSPHRAEQKGRFGLVLASVLVIGGALVVPASSAHALRQLDRPNRAQIGAAMAIPEGRLRLAGPPVGFWGGEYTTSSNERVTIYTSSSYAVDEAANQRWADFMGRLLHGSELSRVTVYFATPFEANRLCSGTADLVHNVLGCYGSSTIVAPGEDTTKVSAESVLTHEYGHHIAANRSNAPWRAIDWGAKRWATAMNICALSKAHVVFPGDESLLYRLNPGEGFAETYRGFSERTEGHHVGPWGVLDTVLYPGGDAVPAIVADVLNPWTGNQTKSFHGRFTAHGPSVKTFTFKSRFDGTFSASATSHARIRIAILNWRTVVARGRGSAHTTLCGGVRERDVRVIRTRGNGSFTLTVSLP